MTLDVVAWGLILLAIADIGATVALIRGANRVHEIALLERAVAAVILTVIVSIGAFLSLTYLSHTRLDQDVYTVLLVIAFGAASVPQLIWYATLRAGRFQ